MRDDYNLLMFGLDDSDVLVHILPQHFIFRSFREHQVLMEAPSPTPTPMAINEASLTTSTLQ